MHVYVCMVYGTAPRAPGPGPPLPHPLPVTLCAIDLTILFTNAPDWRVKFVFIAPIAATGSVFLLHLSLQLSTYLCLSDNTKNIS